MIVVKDLTKSFGPFLAVDHISFEMKKGDVLGFLGPNGAGKSTTMKMLSCFLTPTGGSATVAGSSILEDPQSVQSKIGHVPENAPLYPEMYVREFLEFIARMRDIPRAQELEAVNRVIETCSLQEVQGKLIESLSKGYKRRVSLAQALIHDPEVLILDEPTDGLDPNQKHEIRKLIRKLSQKKSILLSTHILEEVEAICNRVIIIAGGKILYQGTPEEFKRASKVSSYDDVFRALTLKESVEGVDLKKLGGTVR